MTNSSHVTTHKVRQKTRPLEAFGRETKVDARGSCVLLHGWDSTGSDMGPLCAAFQRLPSAVDWNFYTPTYETHTWTFVKAARDLYPHIREMMQPLILLGHSEGAIVSRQLILEGLRIKALVAICGPHLGFGTWIPTPDAGTASLSLFSADLERLNTSPKERMHRHAYHLFAISFSDLWGDHRDDGVVPVSSARGKGLGPMAARETIHLEYGDELAGWDPHFRGTDPASLQRVLDKCSQLFEA
jgi:pimeloyl-ACP methyl ester carboxylesterase